MPTEFESSKPIYMQIVDRINFNIVQGKQPLGEKLPSVREMAVQMGVNPNTIQRAYSELERMNIVETRRGQGTFVLDDTKLLIELRRSYQTEIINTFVESMLEIGVSKEDMVKILSQHLKGEKQ
ncbi:GntR family transcriptional regulator [Aquibacillus kalidii]|uniref:GntR family transcriptional regulator n=1 Tax=Aquibacillus kalidii TaxID=2762597 RepID=UPI0016453543|nr:GntR family transcriptional regulator [Aquibacillus kalidii]